MESLEVINAAAFDVVAGINFLQFRSGDDFNALVAGCISFSIESSELKPWSLLLLFELLTFDELPAEWLLFLSVGFVINMARKKKN